MSAILVVYYSRTGHTMQVAQRLAAALDADLERIEEEGVSRSGFLGYMFSGWQGLHRKHAVIRSPVHDVTAYDLVIAGTPIWAGNLSSPMRSYLESVAGKVKAAAFFCTMGGSGGKRAFRQMADILSLAPKATLEVTAGELNHIDGHTKIDGFARQLAQRIP